MSEHRTHRTVGDAYQLTQQLRAPLRIVADSDSIRTGGVQLRRLTPPGVTPRDTRFVKAPAARPGIGKRIDESIRRAAKVGLGKLARLNRRRGA